MRSLMFTTQRLKECLCPSDRDPGSRREILDPGTSRKPSRLFVLDLLDTYTLV